MNDNLMVIALHGAQRWVERKTGVLFGIYRWRMGPKFHLIIGSSDRADTFLELGALGRTFWMAREPE